ncbi:MAG: restriction endonuclease subunit S [Fibrobacter sp.]|nr:restriction endonuclease subunit S [Fibrobacter sp.]
MNPEIENRIKTVKMGKVPAGYKKVFGGISPKEWTHAKLGSLFADRNEVDCSDKELLSITAERGVIPRSEIAGKDNSSEDKSKYKCIHVGDIGYNTMRMWQGVSALSAYEGIVSPAYTILNPQKDAFAPYFAYLFKMRYLINLFYRNSQGLVDDTRSLKYEWFKNIEVCIPPIEEQRKIAKILETQDRLIALKEKLIDQKQQQKKCLMQQLLSGFDEKTIDDRRKTKEVFSIDGVNIRKNMWKETTLGSAADIKTGCLPSEILEQGEFPYVNAGCSYSGFTNSSNCPGNVVTTPSRGQGGIGEVFFQEKPFWLGPLSYKIMVKSDVISKLLYYILLMDKRKIIDNKKTGGVPAVNASDLATIKIFLPSLPEQQAIANVLSTADREIELLRKDLEQEKLKKKSLMQLLLTGLVRVK